MQSVPIFPGDKPLVVIRYGYVSQKTPGFISMEGEISNVQGVPYLSCYPDNYSNIYSCPIFRPHVISRYFSAWNAIYNCNRMQQSDLALSVKIYYFGGRFSPSKSVFIYYEFLLLGNSRDTDQWLRSDIQLRLYYAEVPKLDLSKNIVFGANYSKNWHAYI